MIIESFEVKKAKIKSFCIIEILPEPEYEILFLISIFCLIYILNIADVVNILQLDLRSIVYYI